MSEHTITTRFAIAICTHAGAGSCLYAWHVEGIEQAGNVFIFWMWFAATLFALHLVLLVSPPNERPPKNPALAVLNTSAWFFFIVSLVWTGYVTLPAFLVFGLVVERVFESRYDSDGSLKPKEHRDA